MSEDSIFIVKDEQYLLRSKRKRLRKKKKNCLYCSLFMYVRVHIDNILSFLPPQSQILADALEITQWKWTIKVSD